MSTRWVTQQGIVNAGNVVVWGTDGVIQDASGTVSALTITTLDAGTATVDGAVTIGSGSENIGTITPGATSSNTVTIGTSASAGLELLNNTAVDGTFTIGSGSENTTTITPGAASKNPTTIAASGTAGIEFTSIIGFNSTAPVGLQTVTGSRASNAALASLLTALANYGLIKDSTS